MQHNASAHNHKLEKTTFCGDFISQCREKLTLLG